MTFHQATVEPTSNGAEIFKMLWPIIGDTILVYNKNRSIEFQLPTSMLDGSDLLGFLEEELKCFVKGHITADSRFNIVEVAGGHDYAAW